MGIKNLFLVFSTIVLISTSAFAEDISFTAKLNSETTIVNKPVELTITITGNSSAQEPDVPFNQDLEIRPIGTSSQMQIINGEVTNSMSYNYIVIPKKEGKFVIKDISTIIDGNKVFASPIEVNVTSEDKPEENKSKNEKMIYAEANINKKTVFENEPFIYTLKLYRSIRTGEYSVKFPDFKNFWVDDFEKAKEYYETINGKKYIVTEVKKALTSSKIGKIKIEKGMFNVEVLYQVDDDQFGGFFSQTETKLEDFYSNDISVKVKSLPSYGKPINFSGIVGKQIDVESRFSQDTAQVGDSIDLTIIFTGKANLNDLKLEFPNIEGFKVYPDKPIDRNFFDGKDLIFDRRFKISLVPTKGGKLEIPSISIPYYDTEKNRYSYLKTKKTVINVSGSSESIKNDSEQKQINNKNSTSISGSIINNKVNNNDLFIDSDIVENKALNGKNLLIYILLFILSGLITLILKFKNKIIPKNIKKSNTKNIISTINKDLSIEEIISKFYIYLEDNFNINKNSNLKAELSKLGLTNIDVDKINLTIEKYEYIKFSGLSDNKDSKEVLFKLVIESIEILEKLK